MMVNICLILLLKSSSNSLISTAFVRSTGGAGLTGRVGQVAIMVSWCHRGHGGEPRPGPWCRVVRWVATRRAGATWIVEAYSPGRGYSVMVKSDPSNEAGISRIDGTADCRRRLGRTALPPTPTLRPKLVVRLKPSVTDGASASNSDSPSPSRRVDGAIFKGRLASQGS